MAMAVALEKEEEIKERMTKEGKVTKMKAAKEEIAH